MRSYIEIFVYFVFSVDVLLLILMSWCSYTNAYNLLKESYHTYDRPFRVILLMQCFFFLHANLEAFQRHIDFFIVHDDYHITTEAVQSLLSDRGAMLFTGMCAFLLTRKWAPEWFKKLLK